jgi:hypothetical protein
VGVERPIRVPSESAGGGIVLTQRFFQSYDNHILLCTDDNAVVLQRGAEFTPATLDWLKHKHEERPDIPASLTVHTAVFLPASEPYYFLKVRNWSRDPVQLNRVWFATDPPAEIENVARPLPTSIEPGDLFETWIPTRLVPPAPNIDFAARALFDDGLLLSSEPNSSMAPSGVVGGAGRPLASFIEAVAALNHAGGKLVSKEWDAFISHASHDKAAVVEPLANALRNRGLRIWYDGFEMRLGDSLRRKIDEGIARSSFGVIVLSPHFFARPWTNYEMDGLVNRATAGGQIMLPIWHNVTEAQVAEYSPSLADKIACNTATSTIDEIADLIHEVVKAATRV